MYLWDLQTQGRPNSSMIDTQITTLSRLEKIYGATDIWGNQWSWLTISPDRCALSIPSDSWIDTLSKYQKKGGFNWWMPEIIILTTNRHPYHWYDWATDHYRKRLLNVACHHIWDFDPHGVDQETMRDMKERSKWTKIPFGTIGEHCKNTHK